MNFFRRHLESRVTKVIAVIIALIFISWEFTSSMLRQPKTWVIKVGEMEYSAKDWQKSYKHFTQDPLSAQEAMINPRYAKQRVLDEMVRNAMILQEAEAVGLRVNDKMAASEIIHMKSFQNDDKKFDRDKLEDILKGSGMTEADFLKNVKENILRSQLMDIFYNTSGIIGIPTFNLLLKLITAEQNITLYKVPLIKESAQPSDDDLKKFLNENKDKFMTEDVAEISKITFTADLIKIKPVTEDEVKEFYEKYAVVEPERRTVNQIVISSHNEAKEVLEKIKSGKISYDEAAKFYKQKQMIPYEIGPFTSEEFDQDIAKVVFALPLNQVSDLVQTPIGWHIFRVSKINEAKAKDLELIRDEIVKKLADQKFTEEMNKLVEKVMEEINLKLSLVDIASKYNLRVEKTIEKGRRLPSGVVDVFSIPDDLLEDGISKKRMVATAFVNDNEVKLLASKDNRSFIVLKTDQLIPGRLMRFQDVKEDLMREYLNGQNEQKTKELAKKYRSDLLENKDGDKPASEELRISRIRKNDSVPHCIEKLIGEMNKNGIYDGITIPCQEDDNYFFAKLNSIDFSVEVSDEEKSSLRQPVLSIYNEMIFSQFLTNLKKKYKLEIDEQFEKYLNE